jgi:hypothetical protein
MKLGIFIVTFISDYEVGLDWQSIYWITTSRNYEADGVILVTSLHSLRMDHIENTASVVDKTCLLHVA